MDGRRVGGIAIALVLVLSSPVVALAAGETTGSSGNRYYYSEVVSAGNKGYANAERIKEDDPHYGWQLGRFVVSGFTSRIDGDTPVFLKNVGDEVALSFILDQDIDALNGNEEIRIHEDEDGYDEHFGIERQIFGRGTLIVRHTDYQNSSTKPQVYVDYLPALTVGAETQIDLFEEGDYEVTLDYEVESPWFIPIVGFAHNYNNYRISFRFKVRNSNAMAFLFDTETGSELVNGSVTPNGFRIDTAGSHYLDINVRRDVLNEAGDEIVEDTRFNRAATDGSVFTDEGIYTVTIENSTTGEETSKTIYVGANDLLKATVANQMDIADVEDQIAQGAVVAEDGTLMYAAVDLDVEEAQPEETAQEPEKVPEKNEGSGQASAGESDPADDDGSSMVLPIAGIVGVAALGAAGYGISRKGKKE